LVALAQPEGGISRYSVVPRNLSSQGLAFIHGQFIYEGSRCEVVLPALDQSWIRKSGMIAMCRHVKGFVHETSVVFDDPIHLDRFVESSASQSSATVSCADDLTVHPMVGRVMVIDPFDSDRHLLTLWLERMGLQTRSCSSIAEALNSQPQRFDLIMMDPIRQSDDWEVVVRMREAGITESIIGLSADDRDESRACAQAAGCNAFIGKPWRPHTLRLAIEQLLLINPDNHHVHGDGPLYSRFASDAQMLPLIEAFAYDIQRIGDELEVAMTHQDLTALRGLCQQVKGAGDGYGFAALTDQARCASQLFQVVQSDTESVDRAITELIKVIRRVCVR
jgi:CheY-like chemotaxis protein